MGGGWRRVSEAVRQKVGIMDREFKSTTNGRNEAMFKEATDFSVHLRTLERDLRAMQKQVDAHFTNMRNILISPLPRAYEEGQNGPAPIEEEPRPIGQNVHIDRITSSAGEMKRRLDNEVIQPVKEWMVAYRTISDRMRQLEAVRLELDSRRRTVSELQTKFERAKASAPPAHKAQMLVESIEKELVHKEEKMLRTLAHYQEMERTVYNSLFTLVKDTSVLRDYAAAALNIIQDCFRDAAAAFEAPGGALEYSTTMAPGVYGQVAGAATAQDNKYLAVAEDKSKSGGVKGLMRQLSDRITGNTPSATAGVSGRLSKPSQDYSGGAGDRDDPRMAYDQVNPGGYGGFDAAHLGGPKMMPMAQQHDASPHMQPQTDAYSHTQGYGRPQSGFMPSPGRYTSGQQW